MKTLDKLLDTAIDMVGTLTATLLVVALGTGTGAIVLAVLGQAITR